ncbi:MAG: enoyl-CoA hydratase/isomerase family protein [Deltaproteobacteria bacterium]|nr:enoyl-CoA hydratase/isomerase family protein [Deltaproteobacteria bacterium]MBI3388278.1 enoyl-CoA hydratase/isomerase family protein [Deltaproteobacteria bacterium]
MTIETRDVDGGVRILTLNRPPANAINAELMNDLHTVCEAAKNDGAVRSVIVTGSGKFFSGGLDLKMLTTAAQGGTGSGFGSKDGVFSLWTLSKPTIAMVNGHAIAGGGIILLACDVRIAARGNAKIGLNETAIGLPLPTGAFEITALALSNRQARTIMLDAELHNPDRARDLGMLDDVVEPSDLERVCIEKARLLGSYSQPAYAHTKRLLQQHAVDAVVTETDAQRRATFDVWTSPETMQALMKQLSGISSSGLKK